MSLGRDRQPRRPPQNRTQRIVMWSIYAVAAVLLVVAVVIFISSGAALF